MHNHLVISQIIIIIICNRAIHTGTAVHLLNKVYNMYIYVHTRVMVCCSMYMYLLNLQLYYSSTPRGRQPPGTPESTETMCTLKKRCLEKQNPCAQTQTRIYTDENSENGVYFRNGVEKNNRCWEKQNPCWKLTPMQSVLIFKTVCIPSPYASETVE